MKKIIIILIVLTNWILLISQTTVPAGNVSGNWTYENSPYLIEGEITIPDGETLTIDPGVLVEFQGHYKFNVQGRLLAIGTEQDSICFTINDTTGFSNYCSWDGAWHGLRFYNTNNNINDTLKLIYCKIEYGKAISFNPEEGCGGAIFCHNSSNILIQNSLISNNISNQDGGAICCKNNSDISIQNVIIRNNLAQGGGGAIFLDHSSPYLKRVLIVNNKNIVWFGTVWCYNFSNPVFENVTITDNMSDNPNNNTIYLYDTCMPVIVNCIIRNDFSYEIFCNGVGGFNIITICYTNLNGGEDGIGTNYNGFTHWLEGNIDFDPLFVDPENGNFHLQDDSPCIDAGIAFFEWNGNVIINLEENEYYGVAPDMGCYEWQVVNINGCEIEKAVEYINNYPNPFNPETTINYQLPAVSKVQLSIYNIKGQKVKTLISDQLPAGEHSIIWDGSDSNGKRVSSGIYFYKLKTANFEKTRKMILLR